MNRSITGTLGQYARLVGRARVAAVRERARTLQPAHVAHVNSTFYGGGVAEILSSLTLLMNEAGVRTEWRLIRGSPDFFTITKKWHNALQGHELNLTRRKLAIYEETLRENAMRIHLDHDFVVVHDPQPLALIRHFRHRSPWTWRCHIDLTDPHPALWAYLREVVEQYDAVVMTSEAYRRELETPQVFWAPAIDPFTMKNRPMTEREIAERLRKYRIPTDLPIVAQVARFDPWKDPEAAIRAVRLAREETPCTLVLLGNFATDDPEGQAVYERLVDCQEDRIRIIAAQDSALVNAVQRRAQVVLQMSRREGFGLTVTEALWKGTPVVARRVGGIPLQVEDGHNGFLVADEHEAAARVVQLLSEPRLRERLGEAARDTVKERFLMIRLLEDWLALLGGFHPRFELHRS